MDQFAGQRGQILRCKGMPLTAGLGTLDPAKGRRVSKATLDSQCAGRVCAERREICDWWAMA